VSGLRSQLTLLLNQNSAENGSNTPDWVLGEYLAACLTAFDEAVNAREAWYGREEKPPTPIKYTDGRIH
jgi:hypothetical protein